MKKLIISLVFALTINSFIFSQSFKTFISDTTNYNYWTIPSIYEKNNTYSFFLIQTPRDSTDYGNLNYIKLDNAGNIIKDTILFSGMKFQYARIIKSNNYYYMMTMHVNKTDSLNGRIFKLDSAFNIINQKKLPYFGDSTFFVSDIVEVENNNIVFMWYQMDQPANWPPRSIMQKTNENLDSLKFNNFSFFSNTFVHDSVNNQYIAMPIEPNDTIFAYISYNLSLDSVQLAPNYLPQYLGRYQNSVLLLSNHKKIYGNTSADGGGYYMGIYLFDKDMQVLNYCLLKNDAYPGEYKNLSFINNTEYIYFVGTTNYNSYPEDSNSIILSRLDTNLNIDYVRYFHNDRSLRPYYITTTSDNGCIVIGRIGYISSSYIRGTFVIKFDSLGNLVWQHGVNLQEQAALVYPNPAQNTLYVKTGLTKQKLNFAIFDMQGKKIISRTLREMENSLDISTLSTGVYIYRITDKEKTLQTGKIVKE